MNAPQPIPIGTHVLACWRGAMMYPGVVTARPENFHTMKWDDDDTALEVPRKRIAPMGEDASTMSSVYRSLQ